jgi:hypothetical protein
MWEDISGSRGFTQSGPMEIPYPVKIMWLDENEVFCPDERNDYLQMISQLDGTYLEKSYEKTKVK